MDYADQSDMEIFSHIENSISKLTNSTKKKLKPKGECYTCWEELEYPKLFCGRDCADKYQE